MVLILLPLLCNHDKLISEKKGEGWLVIGRFKVGSVPEMINKKVLDNLHINLHDQLKKCLPIKISKFMTRCILKKGGG